MREKTSSVWNARWKKLSYLKRIHWQANDITPS